MIFEEFSISFCMLGFSGLIGPDQARGNLFTWLRLHFKSEKLCSDGLIDSYCFPLSIDHDSHQCMHVLYQGRF